ASVGGIVSPHFVALMNVPTVIVSAAGTLTNAGASVPGHTVVISYSLAFGAHDLTLNTLADWAPAGMTRNETSVGRYFQRIWDAGGALPLATDMGILGNMTALGDYADALNHMTPAVYASALAGARSGIGDFADGMMSCHRASGSPIAEQD